MTKTATMTFNPRCGTARKTKAILEEEGYDVTVIEYLKTPLSRDELKRLYDRAGMSAKDGLRAKEQIAKDMNLADASDDEILDAMVEHPILVNRPLVETEKGVILARPQDEVRKIL
ncbi:arsenate reductase family protein [Sphingomicrobium sediminis]|uniref:Arsenate reductase n=1 Tax=Sphingomicrobium sediminis TaxID=2950949 RepID=A0A9X2EG60_9SPHN|nr:arsenate reductase family protein [Sphingomicrobium sediminis]MCM8557398.1 arsenate reductase family protein [Sphingomicrobium sediminis]